MDKKFLESTEFYEIRYRNFSTLIIAPILLLIILCFIFSFLGRKEIIVKGIGEIVPIKSVSKIQSISSNQIVLNNLENNKKVKKNDVLLRYNMDANKLRLNDLDQQLTEVSLQIDSAYLLKESLEKGKSLFTEADKYGYFETFKSFENAISSVEYEITMENNSIARQNNNIEKSKIAIHKEEQELLLRIRQQQEFKEALISDRELGKEHALYSKMSIYNSQISKESEIKDEIKHTFIIEVDEIMTQMESVLNGLNTQKENLGSFLPNIDNLSNRKAEIKHQELISSHKELVQLEKNRAELKHEITIEQKLIGLGEIKAATSGILNVDSNFLGMETIAVGVTIAEIFPNMREQQEIELSILLPTTDIVGIKKGLTVRFKLIQSIPKMKLLEGEIKNVSVAPADYEEGSYFEVKARVAVSEADLEVIDYGLRGEAVIIIGEKTFFNYYKEKIISN